MFCAIARAALGDPYVFDRMLHYLTKGKEKEFSFTKNIKAFAQYLSLAKKHNISNIGRIKYIGANFFRDIPGAGKLRNEFMGLKTLEEITDFVKKQI